MLDDRNSAGHLQVFFVDIVRMFFSDIVLGKADRSRTTQRECGQGFHSRRSIVDIARNAVQYLEST